MAKMHFFLLIVLIFSFYDDAVCPVLLLLQLMHINKIDLRERWVLVLGPSNKIRRITMFYIHKLQRYLFDGYTRYHDCLHVCIFLFTTDKQKILLCAQ